MAIDLPGKVFIPAAITTHERAANAWKPAQNT